MTTVCGSPSATGSTGEPGPTGATGPSETGAPSHPTAGYFVVTSNGDVPSVPVPGIDNVLGDIDSPFLYVTGGQGNQSTDVNTGLVSDLTVIGGSQSTSLTNATGLGEMPNVPGGGAINVPQEDGASHAQNLVRPMP